MTMIKLLRHRYSRLDSEVRHVNTDDLMLPCQRFAVIAGILINSFIHRSSNILCCCVSLFFDSTIKAISDENGPTQGFVPEMSIPSIAIVSVADVRDVQKTFD